MVLFCEHTAAELDAILAGLGYTTPILSTATRAHTLLKYYNALGGAAMVEQSAPTPAGKRGDSFHLWEEAKKMLAAGMLELDAPRDEATSSPRSGFGESGGAVASPWFFRTQEF